MENGKNHFCFPKRCL